MAAKPSSESKQYQVALYRWREDNGKNHAGL